MTGNDNALDFANTTRTISIQQCSSATVVEELGTLGRLFLVVILYYVHAHTLVSKFTSKTHYSKCQLEKLTLSDLLHISVEHLRWLYRDFATTRSIETDVSITELQVHVCM